MLVTCRHQFTAHGETGLIVRKIHVHIDRIIPQFHRLDHRHTGVQQHLPGSGGMVVTGDDDAVRTPAKYGAADVFFFFDRFIGIAEQDLIAPGGEKISAQD